MWAGVSRGPLLRELTAGAIALAAMTSGCRRATSAPMIGADASITVTAASAQPASPLVSMTVLSSWAEEEARERLRTSLTSLIGKVRRFDAEFDPNELDGVPVSCRLDVFRGQLNGDAYDDAIVQVTIREAGHTMGMDDREAFWIGFFEGTDKGLMFVGKRSEALIGCSFGYEHKPALRLGFMPAKPAIGAELWIEVQRTRACGTLIDYEFERALYRIEEHGVQMRSVAPVKERVGPFDRTHPSGE